MLVPCGNTMAHVCPACAERAKTLRAAQCREGWHLEDEPDITPDPATEDQRFWIEKRAEAQQLRDQAAAAEQDTTDFDELLTALDEEITKAASAGRSPRTARRDGTARPRRRQDAPDQLKRVHRCRTDLGYLSGRGRSRPSISRLALRASRAGGAMVGPACHRRAGQRARRAGLLESRRCYALFLTQAATCPRAGGDARS